MGIAADEAIPSDATIPYVTYIASIYRSSSDYGNKKFPYKNLPSTSEILNTTRLKIRFGAKDKNPKTQLTFSSHQRSSLKM